MAQDNPLHAAPPGPGFIGNLMRLVGRAKTQDPIRLADALLSERGEASGVALAGELLAAYGTLTTEERIDFLLSGASSTTRGSRACSASSRRRRRAAWTGAIWTF